MKPVLFLLTLSLIGCAQVDVVTHLSSGGEDGDEPKVVGTGKPIVETRKAQAATAADFSGALQVTIRSGAPKLTVEAQKEILPHIRTEFKGGRLRVWTEGSMQTDGPVRVVFATPIRSDLAASGATSVEADALVGKMLQIELAGASRIKASGRAESVGLIMRGASTADVVDLTGGRVDLDVSGASTVNVGSPDRLTGSVSGASSVYYQRKPRSIQVQTSGASNVHMNK